MTTAAPTLKPIAQAIKYAYDTVIYIGRFQPFHNAHLETIMHAMTLAYRVIVAVGSANEPRDEDNPFTQDERMEVIRESIHDACIARNIPVDDLDDRLKFISVENQRYSNAGWGMDVAAQVQPLLLGDNVKLIGHSKDDSSFYLKMFPQWGEPIEMPLVEILDATTIRELYFSPKCNLNLFKGVVPSATARFLERFLTSTNYQYVVDEAKYIRDYRKQFEHLPYPITFNTGDAIVFKDGHVLLIRRKSNPGKNLLAFPGGFVNAKTYTNKKGELIKADASMLECGIRELFEETKIKLPEALIRGCIKEEKVFDAVNRSRRGRVITTAQIIVLPSDGKGLPKVKGSDDAKEAIWVPVHMLSRIQFFEDHYDMLLYALSQLKKYQ
jgi:bifunctional NMN adenylyltransferase/nudix hydrolase